MALDDSKVTILKSENSNIRILDGFEGQIFQRKNVRCEVVLGRMVANKGHSAAFQS